MHLFDLQFALVLRTNVKTVPSDVLRASDKTGLQQLGVLGVALVASQQLRPVFCGRLA
jgi:hypothetical protein